MADQPVTPFRPSYALCAACARGDHSNCVPSFMQYDVWTWCDCKHDAAPVAGGA